jgi:3-oxoacyl-[acyl-carrier protein] reductase
MSETMQTVAVVTGASSGLGAAVAAGLAKAGHHVVVNYARDADGAERTAQAVRAAGREAVIVQGDVADDAACRAIAAAAAPWGRIDVLVNNAGITKHAADHGDLDALSMEDFQRLYAVNVVAPFQMVRACRPFLEASHVATGLAAPVVMISSIAGVAGVGSSVAYAASKGALNTMTLSLARALAPKIRVNAICPGYIDTPWFVKGVGEDQTSRLRAAVAASTPLRAASTAEDIADTVLAFCGPATRHVTGETLIVDAGMHLGFAPLKAR